MADLCAGCKKPTRTTSGPGTKDPRATRIKLLNSQGYLLGYELERGFTKPALVCHECMATLVIQAVA